MASFNFNLQQPYRKDKNGNKVPATELTRVYLFVIHDRNNVCKLKTEFNIIPTKWDFDKQRVKHQVPGSVPINDSLDKLIADVTNEYNSIRADYPAMKFDEIARNLKAFVKDKISPVYNDKSKTFSEAFLDYIEYKKGEVIPRTAQKYDTVRRTLLEFSPDVTFDKIDLNFYDKFKNYLRICAPKGRQLTRDEEEQKGLLNDSAAKVQLIFKAFLKWAYIRKYHTNAVFQEPDFKIEKVLKKDIVTLGMDELKKFYEHDFTANPRLDRVRDVFCFGCFTGQRWSDIAAFDRDQLSGERWKFKSFKTGKDIVVPLVGYAGPALTILQKYDFHLPSISAQKNNDYLKEAAELAGLDRMVRISRYVGKREIITEKPLHEFMSSHMGRRTAVSLLLNVEKMQLHQVREITGHGDLRTLDLYLNKDTEALTESMKQTQGINKPVMTVVKTKAG